jgi:hypothetical protein
MKKVSQVLIVALLISIAITTPSYSAEKNPYGTLTVDPAGPNEVILTITKGDRTAHFAYSRLLKMKSRTITINEPFIKKRQTFTVIPIKNLFGFVGISGRDLVSTRALNDYLFEDTAAQFIKAGAYLAIKKNGKAIGYNEGGPIRLVYIDSSPWANYLDSWNWSIASITVK